MKPIFLAAAFGLTLSGCAHEYVTRQLDSRADDAKRSVLNDRTARPTVLESDGLHIRGIPVEYVPPPKGTITLSVNEQPVMQVLASLAEGMNYSTSFATGVDARAPISVSLRGMEQLAALREIAFAAGLVAVVNKASRTVTLAREATYTYRLPGQAIQALQSRYQMSSGGIQGPSSGANGSSTGASGTGSQGGASSSGAYANPSGTQANSASGSGGNSGAMFISGNFDTHPRQIADFLRTVSGAEVALLQDQGLLMGRGNATQLRRLQQFVETLSRDALTQVEVELSLVDVAVNTDVETGIDWQRVIGPNLAFGSANGSVSVSGGNAAALEGGRIAVTTRSIDAIVRALERTTSVQEVVRPRLTTHNNVATIYRDVTRRPFVPSVQTTVTPGQGNVVQNSATVEYFSEGVSFSMRPSVLDHGRASLMLLPVVSNVTNVQTFQVSKDIALNAPIQPTQDAALSVIGQHGKTLVIAGLRSHRAGDSTSGVPVASRIPGINWLAGGRSDRAAARELVMLVHTRIIPGPELDVVIGEAL